MQHREPLLIENNFIFFLNHDKSRIEFKLCISIYIKEQDLPEFVQQLSKGKSAAILGIEQLSPANFLDMIVFQDIGHHTFDGKSCLIANLEDRSCKVG